MASLTIADAIERFAVDVDPHLDRQAFIPILDGLQFQGADGRGYRSGQRDDGFGGHGPSISNGRSKIHGRSRPRRTCRAGTG